MASEEDADPDSRQSSDGGAMMLERFRRVLAKLRILFASRHAEEELARELAAHVALLEDDFLRSGMTPEGARQAARKTIGGVEQTKQAHRDERSIPWLEQTVQDLRHARRTLARSPGFTIVAVITLALGIGANTTLFTAYDAVALKPLPIADPARVVRLERWFAHGWLGDMQYGFSWPEYLYCREHQDVFSDLVATSWPVRVLARLPGSNQATQPMALQGQMVSGNYFRSFGVEARLGRTFGPEEDRAAGADPVIVLSYAFWKRAFHGDRQIVGSLARINGTEFSILGVAPEEFTGTALLPQVPDFWTPASMQAQVVPGQDWLHQPTDYRFQVLGRLRNEVGARRAEAETAALIHQFSTTYISREPTRTVTLQHTAFFGNTEDPRFEAGVAVLMLIVAMVLFVACANIANMLLARGAVRQREISLRLALGASRARVIRQLITESVLLSLLGGVAGWGFSVVASKVLRVAVAQMLTAQLGSDFAFSLNLNPDVRVLAYALLLSLIAGVVFGLSPALQFTKPELASSFRDESTSFGHHLRRSHLRSLLIGGQVGVSMLLLTCSGLLVRGLMRSQTADPGFNTLQVFLLLGDYGDSPATSVVRFQRLVSRLEEAHELKSVSYGRGPMMGTWTPPMMVRKQGAVEGVARGRTLASYASRDYLNTLGIPLLRGRDFTRQESSAGAHVAVISEAAARLFWPGEDPIGRHFQLDLRFTGKLTDFEVVGVAKDVRFTNLTRIDPAHVYLAPDPTMTYPILLNVGANQHAALAAVWKAVSSIDANLLPDLSLWNTETMLVHPHRTLARVMAMFAAGLGLLAVALAGVGIYGVMAYVVSQRTQEIGIQMALGARSDDVLRSVALWGLKPVAAGMLVGLGCGAAASAVLHSTLAFPGSSDFLYGVRFYDPWTFAGISLFLITVSILASLIPAFRAVRVDPMVALRYQ
jgi:macrolide transport system ATP-binding/permease protein